ncbi:hypothetical protein [Sphingorhabdus sp. Alg231-15]|uniref:hypothetical protein n=1 Tax=Sphingorhabdus sp. Alg231-15 TaxID=1922222 RepID=UPI000D55C389
MSSNLTRINLENRNDGKLLHPGIALEADGAIVDEIELDWVGPNHLLIKICNATGLKVRSRFRRDPITNPDGSENSIFIDVENFRYSDFEQRCIKL